MLLLGGCKSVPNESPPPIPVPNGLNANDVELAILLTISDPNSQQPLSPGQQITDNVLTALLGSYDSVSNQRQTWFFEDREPGRIFLGYQRGHFYMRVAAKFDAESITLSIVDSRNLDQTETHIHKGAFSRLATLDYAIRRSLGRVAQRNLSERGS